MNPKSNMSWRFISPISYNCHYSSNMAFWEPLNIVSELHLRDLGSFRVPGAAHRINSTFHSRQILRQVILASHRVYKPLLSSALTSPKDSLYCDGKLYLKQDQIYQCLALRDGSVVSSDELLHLYTLPATPKWEDQEMWSGSLPEFLTPPLAFNAHKSTLIVLQKGGWLTFYDGAQGQKRQSVFLSNSVNYREMVCDSESSSIVLKSTRLMMDDREEGIFIRRSRSLLSMMVFHFPPLAFTAHFSVSKHIFGSNIVDAVISHDLLIVMHSDDSLRAYSLSYIFEKVKRWLRFRWLIYMCNKDLSGFGFQFTLRHFNIGDVDESDLEFRYGQHPVGFPYNVDITHLPPCLFQVKSKQHHLQIGSFPWKYIIRESHSKCEVGKQTQVVLGQITITLGNVWLLRCSISKMKRRFVMEASSFRTISNRMRSYFTRMSHRDWFTSLQMLSSKNIPPIHQVSMGGR